MSNQPNSIEEIRVRRVIDPDADISWLEPDSGRWDDLEDPSDREQNQAADAKRLASYGDAWSMIGVDAVAIVRVRGIRQEITSGGLWNIESDSSDDYLREIGTEQLDELWAILREIGFDEDDMREAFSTDPTPGAYV